MWSKELLRSDVRDKVALFRQRPKSPPAKASLRDAVLITGGMGDLFAVESFLSDEERARIRIVLYATQKHDLIQQLLEALPNFRNLSTHRVVWNDFAKFWHFLRKDELLQKLGPACDDIVRYSEDWSIEDLFPRLTFSPNRYNGSSFLRFPIAGVDQFSLPEAYAVIQPYSTDKREEARDFTREDWQATLQWLRGRKIVGVVVNTGGGAVPNEPELLNLSNQTTVCEAVEVLKRACGYIGIDSWLCVLAAKIFEDDSLCVKSNIPHCYKYKHIYFAPKAKFDFLASDIRKVLKL